MAASDTKIEYEAEFEVEFGGVGINVHDGIGMRIRAEKITQAKMNRFFRGAQLSVRIACSPNSDGDAKGQQLLAFDQMELTVEGVVECQRYVCNPNGYSVRLTFPHKSLDMASLGDYPKHSGRIMVKRMGDAKAIVDEGSESEE